MEPSRAKYFVGASSRFSYKSFEDALAGAKDNPPGEYTIYKKVGRIQVKSPEPVTNSVEVLEKYDN